MKAIVYYKSKTGFTRKYAGWIAAALGCDLAEANALNLKRAGDFDVVIYGGGLYVRGIHGLKAFLRNPFLKPDVKIIVFATGATPLRDETTRQLREINFPEPQQRQISFFYLRGGFDFSKLGPWDQFLMTLLKLKLRLKPEHRRSPDEKGMLAAYEGSADFSKERYIDELVSLVKGLM